MKIKLSKQAVKELDKIDKATAKRILEVISGLPAKGDIKPLKGFKNKYRLRVGSYRILYSIHEDEIHITDLGPRGDIYK